MSRAAVGALSIGRCSEIERGSKGCLRKYATKVQSFPFSGLRGMEGCVSLTKFAIYYSSPSWRCCWMLINVTVIRRRVR